MKRPQFGTLGSVSQKRSRNQQGLGNTIHQEDNLRIAIMTELYLPHIGGQEMRYAELAQALLQAGHSVNVFAIRHARELLHKETVRGVRIWRYPLAVNYEKPLFKSLRRAQIPLCQYALWVRRHIRHEDYDLLLFNQWPLAHIVAATSAVRRKAVIDWCELRDGKILSFVQRMLPKLVAANIAVSTSIASRLQNMSGRPVSSIPSGIWVHKYRRAPREARKGLLYIGRVTRHKNLPLLLGAYERLRDGGYTGPLVIAGSGPSFDEVRELAKRSKYSNEIDMPGFIDEEEKQRLLSVAEVLVISSKREGFPRVVAEAMASGLPVATVDYRENGTKDVVREYKIGVVAAPTPSGLMDAIFKVHENWSTYAKNAWHAKDALSWTNLVTRIEQIAEEELNIAPPERTAECNAS
jgi:glycosyltransferase involved in cell wall biosynthesis